MAGVLPPPHLSVLTAAEAPGTGVRKGNEAPLPHRPGPASLKTLVGVARLGLQDGGAPFLSHFPISGCCCLKPQVGEGTEPPYHEYPAWLPQLGSWRQPGQAREAREPISPTPSSRHSSLTGNLHIGSLRCSALECPCLIYHQMRVKFSCNWPF